MISDWDCLERARQGDERAWQWLVVRHSPSLVKTTLLITGSLAIAKDLTQESFFRLLDRSPRHRHGSFKAYLSTIAYRLALKEKKRKSHYVDLEDYEPTDTSPTPLEEMLQEERQRQIAQVIGALPEHQRSILILRFYGQHSYEEIAQITNVPLGTVKSRLFHAVKACRQGLREKGILE